MVGARRCCDTRHLQELLLWRLSLGLVLTSVLSALVEESWWHVLIWNLERAEPRDVRNPESGWSAQAVRASVWGSQEGRVSFGGKS